MKEKKILSLELRSFIEKQIEILERLSDSLIEFQDEYYELKKAYENDLLDALIDYCNQYGVYDIPKVVNKSEKKSFFLVEPIRKKWKISVDAYGVRCLAYYRKQKENFQISEKVFSISELKKFVKSHCFDAYDFNECQKAFELLEWKQGER